MTDPSIIIPTSELVRVLSSVLPFVPPKDDPHFGVLLAWDDEAGILSAAACDTLSGGICVSVCDPGELTEKQEDLYGSVIWGGGDTADWRIFISHDDATQIVKVFRVPALHRVAPLHLSVDVAQTRLTVARHRSEGIPLPGAQLVLTTPDENAPRTFPDVHAQHVSAYGDGAAYASTGSQGMRFAPWRLARFGVVEGDLHLFYAGPDRPAAVQVGDRFNGFIYPISSKASEHAHTTAASATLPAEEAHRG